MLVHYLAVALAKFAKTPFTTAANVLTLALGLACFIAAYGIATYWSSGDSHHPGAERIVYIEQSAFGGEPGVNGSRILVTALLEDIPEIEAVAQVQGSAESSARQAPYSTGERDAYLQSATADAAIFDLLSFEFVEGGRDTALRAPTDVVLTQEAAQRLFGREPALGRTLNIYGLFEFNVSAVIAPMRQPSFMGHGTDAPVRFDVLHNMAGRYPNPPTTWGNVAGITIVRLPPSLPLAAFQARLDAIAGRGEALDPFKITLKAKPIGAITTRLVDDRFLSQSTTGVSTGAVLLALGALVLAVACVNYANLATAQAASRVRETGMRRVLGAGRGQLLAQHALEAALLAVPALGLAVLVVALAAPIFRNAFGADVTYFLGADPKSVLVVIAVALASAMAAAVYPALTLARVRAADALGAGKARTGSGVVARALVGVQFLSASFLLIVVTVTQLQQAHLKTMLFAPQADPVVMLDGIPGGGVGDTPEARAARAARFDTLADLLLAAPQIRSVTTSDVTPWIGGGSFGNVALAQDAGATMLTLQERGVGPGYFETFGLDLLAGRALDPARDGAAPDPGSTELASIVIDRRLAEHLGYDDPAAAVGQTLYRSAQDETPDNPLPKVPYAVVQGVVETDHMRLAGALVAFGVIGGSTFSLDMNFLGGGAQPAIRIDRNDVPGALAAIERVWDELVDPPAPFRARFAESLFDEAYAPFRRIAGAFIALSACALAISTAGLLGMAVHVAARRRREMGVRKTLGATAVRLTRLMLVDFSKPILVANLLAWPLGYLAAQAFLQPFAERIALTPAPFLASLAITLAIAWAAVIGEVLKAASVRPAEVLRHA
jgi:putative ABC transport system permease protein